MRIPKYRKHTTRDIGFIEWRRKRTYFAGPFNSAESRDAYMEFCRENVLNPAPLPKISAHKLTVRGLALAYLDWARQRYPGPRSEYDNCRAAMRPLVRASGDLTAARFGPLKLKEIQKTLATAEKTRGYVNQIIARIKRAFRWAVSEELVAVEVYQALLTVQGVQAGLTGARESPKKRPVPWADIEPVLAELSPIVADMVRFQWHTGARSGSIVRACPEQFTDAGDVWEWRPRHKTEGFTTEEGTELVIAIGPKCQPILLPYLNREPTAALFDPNEASRRNRRYRKRYSSVSYARAIERAMARANRTRAKEDAGLPQKERRASLHWTPHQLRHSKGHSTRPIYGVEGVQAALGHSTVSAAQIYSERRLQLAKRIALETG